MEEDLMIRTIADELIELVKKKGSISMKETGDFLKISPDIVEDIVEFFVEARVLDWDYKFTTPYVVFHKEAYQKIPHLFKEHRHPWKHVSEKDIDQQFLEETRLELKKGKGEFRDIFHKEIPTEEKSNRGLIPTILPNFGGKHISEELRKEAKELVDTMDSVKNISKPAGETRKAKGVDAELLSEIIDEKLRQVKSEAIEKRLDTSEFRTALNKKVDDAVSGFMGSYKNKKDKDEISELVSERVKEATRDYLELHREELSRQIIEGVKKDEVKKEEAKKESLQEPLQKLSEQEREGLTRIIEEVKKLIKLGGIQKAEEKCNELWLYALSLEKIDRNLLLKISSINMALDNMFRNVWDIFNKKSLEIMAQLESGKKALSRDPRKAMKSYQKAIKMESDLPGDFPEEKKKLEREMMRLNIDLVDAYEHLTRNNKLNIVIKNVINIIRKLEAAENIGENRRLIRIIRSISKEVPNELFDHKYRVNRQLLEFYFNEVSRPLKDSEKTEFTNLLAGIKQYASQKDLINTGLKYDELWNFILSVNLDKRYMGGILEATNAIREAYQNEWEEFSGKKEEIGKAIIAGQDYISKMDYKSAMQEYSRAVEMESKMTDIFRDERKKVQNSIMKCYLDLVDAQKLIAIDEKIINLNRELPVIIGDIEKARHNHINNSHNNSNINREILREVLGLYNDIPPELFEHKVRISRQLLSIYSRN